MKAKTRVGKAVALAVLFIVALTGASCEVKPDSSELSAYQAGDPSMILSGYGEMARRGLLHAVLSEGKPQNGAIRLTLPRLNCDRDSCASVSVTGIDGVRRPIGGFPKNSTTLSFPLSKVTGNSFPVAREMGGPYRLLIEAFYERDGQEYKELTTGIIYLTVLRAGYARLSCDSADVAWSVRVGKKCSAQFTTKFRTALCGKGCL